MPNDRARRIVRREELRPEELAEDLPADLHSLEGIRLGQMRLTTPVGSPVHEWIFPALEEAKGLIIVTDDETDFRWRALYDSGLPRDMRRVDILFAAEVLHPEYKDCAIHCKGIVSDPKNPDKGEAIWKWRLTFNRTGEVFTAHIWFAEIFLRNSSAHCLCHYHPATELTSSDVGPPAVSFDVVDVKPGDLKSGHRLIDSTALLSNAQAILDAATKKRGRRPGTGFFFDKAQFLEALRDVLAKSDASVSEPHALLRLSRHSLWQGKQLTLAECQARRKTLRNWLNRCGLTWDDAKRQLCGLNKEGK